MILQEAKSTKAKFGEKYEEFKSVIEHSQLKKTEEHEVANKIELSQDQS